uniref:M96 mating-specific protein family n=1 Tax=Phytophthora ramorum TaxID=164328 RepID=H3HCD4_PHYRM
MAFLAEDDDAMRAFEAVLSFMDDFAVEESSSEDARMLRKAGVYGDPNRARNERKLEIAYLREKVGQLEAALQNVSSIWEGFAARQRTRREKAERENIRLKLVLEGQIKVAKSLEILLVKRAQQQIAECSSSILRPGDVSCPSGRTLDFRADAADFEELLEYLDAAYSEVDAVLAANGLATMEMTQQDLHMREGVMPFGLHATAEATWNYFKGSEKHRGNLYAKAAQSLDTPYTIIEHFSKELFAGNSSTDVRVKQIIRRYVEADREVVVWVATIAPIEIKRKALAGLISHHRNYAVIKRAKDSTPERELSLLQLVAHVTLDTQEGTIYDPKYIRALTDFLLSNAAGNIKADQELIENVLMDQTLQQH